MKKVRKRIRLRKLFDFIGFNGDKSLKKPIKHRFLTLKEEVFILNENSR